MGRGVKGFAQGRQAPRGAGGGGGRRPSAAAERHIAGTPPPPLSSRPAASAPVSCPLHRATNCTPGTTYGPVRLRQLRVARMAILMSLGSATQDGGAGGGRLKSNFRLELGDHPGALPSPLPSPPAFRTLWSTYVMTSRWGYPPGRHRIPPLALPGDCGDPPYWALTPPQLHTGTWAVL